MQPMQPMEPGQPPTRPGGRRAGLVAVLCAVVVAAAAVVVVVAVTRSGGSGGGAPARLVTLPDGCDLLPSGQVQRFVPGHVDTVSQDASPTEKGCTWSNSHDQGQGLAAITVHATLLPDGRRAHTFLGGKGCAAPGARPRGIEGVDEACVDTTLAPGGVTVHARERNVVLRVDHVVHGASSTQLEPSAVSITRAAAAALAHSS